MGVQLLGSLKRICVAFAAAVFLLSFLVSADDKVSVGSLTAADVEEALQVNKNKTLWRTARTSSN
jgi:hypothetical protein